MKTVQHRFVPILSGIAFGFSAAFPLAAGLSKDTSRFPPWWGAADVIIAFLLAVLALAVLGLGQSRITKGVEEETYPRLLGPLKGKRTVWASGHVPDVCF